MKTEDQIQRAHDILVGIILGESPLELNAVQLGDIKLLATSLCWVLDHSYNDKLGELLKEIEEQSLKRGVAIVHNKDNPTRN